MNEYLYGLAHATNWDGSQGIRNILMEMNSSLTIMKNELQRFSSNFLRRGSNFDYAMYITDLFEKAFYVDDELNFFTNLRNTLDEWHTDIENATNPLSEDNAPVFEASVEALKTDTFIGDMYTVADTGHQITDMLSGIQPSQHLYIDTFSGSLCGASIPSKRIDVDLSWYGRIRDTSFNIIRAFLIIGYFILILRNLPSILNGASPLIDKPEQIHDTENYVYSSSGALMSHTITTRDNGVITTRHIRGD